MQEIYTAEQAKTLLSAKDLPHPIAGEVLRLAEAMDHYYGADRKGPLEDGGVVVIVRTQRDLQRFRQLYLDPRIGVCESARILATPKGPWLHLLFLCNNEFGIDLMAPARLLPEVTMEG